MIDLILYRCRIGTYSSHGRNPKFSRKDRSTGGLSAKTRNCTPNAATSLIILLLVLVLIPYSSPFPCFSGNIPQLESSTRSLCFSFNPPNLVIAPPFIVQSRKQTSNFLARYINGNPPRGIKNMHLNVRSVGNKVFEIKNIVKEHSPHILGLSECELKKVGGFFDESKLKVPGYTLLFPKSWNCHGFARVLVYVKKNLEFEQVAELEDNLAQSVWIKASFKGSKKVFFCHLYREHTSTMGNSVRAQRNNLDILLNQWEAATLFGSPEEANETHICGDMNLDCLNNKWLRADYHLISLSRMVQGACDVSNFTQLVNSPTRAQYNRARNVIDISCIDHIYCNTKFRCSQVFVYSFGSSDHDMIGYTRITKEPRPPACTVRKRSYKAFEKDKFLADLSQVDWGPVNFCQDVDKAVTTFTRLFQSI